MRDENNNPGHRQADITLLTLRKTQTPPPSSAANSADNTTKNYNDKNLLTVNELMHGVIYVNNCVSFSDNFTLIIYHRHQDSSDLE